ncbi:DUF333 domain-containing protein [uncultured Sphingomonas sp.]|uniref:DUF333 domain-containing protein n=1 Tax=uncultured Sphingomonas sp. TaxID=158754 RepID=UPI0025F622F3|nr:DUF333 domain-containing protein [uncultured Sphingomonas sp.]
MHRLAYVGITLLICTAVPLLILISGPVSSQTIDENGASGVCLRLGGVGIIVNGAAYCRLRDGRAVDKRLLVLGRRRRAVMPNPASAYCERSGGRLDVVDEPGGQTGYCHLPNGAVIEEWALYRGR